MLWTKTMLEVISASVFLQYKWCHLWSEIMLYVTVMFLKHWTFPVVFCTQNTKGATVICSLKTLNVPYIHLFSFSLPSLSKAWPCGKLLWLRVHLFEHQKSTNCASISMCNMTPTASSGQLYQTPTSTPPPTFRSRILTDLSQWEDSHIVTYGGQECNMTLMPTLG